MGLRTQATKHDTVKGNAGEEQHSAFGGARVDDCATSLGWSGAYELWDLESHKALSKSCWEWSPLLLL